MRRFPSTSTSWEEQGIAHNTQGSRHDPVVGTDRNGLVPTEPTQGWPQNHADTAGILWWAWPSEHTPTYCGSQSTPDTTHEPAIDAAPLTPQTTPTDRHYMIYIIYIITFLMAYMECLGTRALDLLSTGPGKVQIHYLKRIYP